MSRILGVIGDPVANSLSPAIHSLWMQQANIDAIYLPFHLRQSDMAEGDIAALARCGLFGINVTVPHKETALRAAHDADELARKIGAANTLVADDHGRWHAYNTDIYGFESSMASWYGAGWRDMATSVLLIGAGGAARAVVHCLHEAGYALTIVNRSLENARALADSLAPDATVCAISEISAKVREANMVINATSLGHTGGQTLDLGPGDGRLFIDLSYGAAARASLAKMEASGWRTMSGLQMLVAQAASSFHIWFRVRPDEEAAFQLCQRLISEKA